MLRQAISLSVLLSLVLSAHAQSVALTFDDGLNPHTQAEAVTLNASILDALAKANVIGMLLPACKRVDSAEGMQLVTAWGQAGHSIANHTYSHSNLSRPEASAEAFIADVEKCGKVLRAVRGWTNWNRVRKPAADARCIPRTAKRRRCSLIRRHCDYLTRPRTRA